MNRTTQHPIISVIIPTYNYGRFVERAVNSVLSQSYGDFEIIIVDDASSDETEDIIAQYRDPRIHYIRHKFNRGLSSSRNSGIMAAKGEYLAFLDSDDTWLPEKIELQINLFNAGSNDLGIVFTGTKTYFIETSQTFSLPSPSYRGLVLKNLLEGNNLGGGSSSVLIKKKCFDDVGLFDESLRSCEDWDMWIRIAALNYSFDFVDQELVILTIHGNNMSIDNKRMIDGYESILSKHFLLYRRYPNIHALRHYVLGIKCFNEKMIKSGRMNFIKALVYSQPFNFSIKCRSLLQILAASAGYSNYMRIKGLFNNFNWLVLY